MGIVYLSPVDKKSGIIGDMGLTIYNGGNKKIHEHLKHCLKVIEKIAEYTEVGMEFREIHNFAQDIFKKEELNNDRTLGITDSSKTNIGHTIPWTYEAPNKLEQETISDGNMDLLKDIISKKRIHINQDEKFKVQYNIALTVEVRLEDNNNPSLPNVFYHLVVSFIDGQKTISTNFNEIFEIMKMNKYIISKY